MSVQAGSVSPAAARAAIDDVLARPEFRPESDGLGEWIGDRIGDALEWLGELFGFDGDLSAFPLQALLYFLLAIAAALLAVLVMRQWRLLRGARSVREGSPADAEDARRARVAALRDEAARAAADGDRVRALRLYFTALVIGLSERGDLEYRDAWTNRELFERGAPRTDAARELAALVPSLDRKSFGGEPAGPEDVALLAALCERWLGKAA